MSQTQYIIPVSQEKIEISSNPLNNVLFTESPLLGYGSLAALAISTFTLPLYISIIVVLFVIFLLYFYRCPLSIDSKYDVWKVYSPSYGTVKMIKQDTETNTLTIGIFLSPFDVHQQYYPIDGTVLNRVYDNTGKFELAFDMDKSRDNEKKIHIIKGKFDGSTYKVTQIAGLLVRSIVSDEEVNVEVKCGDRFGMIKFGSRVDIEIPNADRFKVNVSIDDVVIGAQTVLGSYFK